MSATPTSETEAPPPPESSPPLRTEIAAGLTTFLTMAYIVVVNPGILSAEGTGMPFAGALSATVLVCFFSTLLMGLFAKLPYALAPGMGLNAFFTYTLVLGQGVSWRAALGLTFLSGVLFLVLSLTPARRKIAEAIPASVRSGAALGVGLFLTFIGLKNAGIVEAHPATFVTLGAPDGPMLCFALGLLVGAVLLRRKSPFAFLAAIAVGTAAGWISGEVSPPERLVALPEIGSVALELDVPGALSLSLLPALIALFFTDLFDSISTFVAVAEASGLKDETGQPKNLHRALIVDALATLGAGLLGSSAGTTYIESAAGVEVGGRTGRTAVVCALCFLPFLFLGPAVAVIPSFATAPVLVLVGALMFRSIDRRALEKVEDLVPLFLSAILIPLTFSITHGILWGFIAHFTLYLLVGRWREVSPLMWVLAPTSVALLLLE